MADILDTFSGYRFDEKGFLKGRGVPDGAAINYTAFQDSLKKYQSENGPMNMYEKTYGMDNRKIADYVRLFKLGPDGKVMAFVPELEKSTSGMQPGWKERRGMGMQDAGKDFGVWVEAPGIVLDESTRSGETSGGYFTLTEEGGAPLASFGKTGYMRLATNAPKAADDLRLGNNSGTASGTVRQNAQRRTLL